ncbi:MAG: hypothetical protein ACRC8Y_21000 [Chroococcales cyanobacterium]
MGAIAEAILGRSPEWGASNTMSLELTRLRGDRRNGGFPIAMAIALRA